jgi:trans-aconitate methyltransferase
VPPAKFFETGEEHIETMLSIIRDRLDPDSRPGARTRLRVRRRSSAHPAGDEMQEVTGVDVSSSMLTEARRNCDAAGASNVRLIQGADELTGVSGAFDFIHSYIVLQHIPVERGEGLVTRLASLLAPGGVAMIQVPYSTGRGTLGSRLLYWARMNAPGAKWALNLARGRTPTAPVMQMNAYSVTRLLDLLSNTGCREVHVRFSDHNGARGALLFARKSEVRFSNNETEDYLRGA